MIMLLVVEYCLKGNVTNTVHEHRRGGLNYEVKVFLVITVQL